MTKKALQLRYEKLAFLLEAEAIEDDAAGKFKLKKQIEQERAEIAELEGMVATPSTEVPRIDVSRLLQFAPARLIGREDDMRVVADAWDQACAVSPGRPRVVSFVALGGEGKTALVAKWLSDLASADWPGAAAVFAWSFYSQGTKDSSAASSDLFLSEVLTFFGDPDTANSPKSAVDKAKRLLHLLREHRTLLVLDGLEPLQYPPSSPMRGRLKDPAIATLLKGLATQSPGLCVLTTRYAVTDLEGAGANVQSHPIKRLSSAAGVELLKALGVHGRAGELKAAVEDVRGHALTLNLLGRYLSDAYEGDVRRRDQVRFEDADAEEQGGHAFRVMDRYVAWFETDEAGRQAMALLRLMGLFDRPAAVPVFASLLVEPALVGLTEAVAGLSEARRNVSLTRLEAAQLLTVEREGKMPVAYDAHPLVREYFARRLQETRGEAWREGHRRLFEYLRTSVEHRPATLEGLQPLYQAVAHGCLAGLHQVACTEVYVDRILRGTDHGGYYSRNMLGVIGTDLGAVACFFDPPWRRLSPTLRSAYQSWLLNEAAFSLHALGRLREAIEPLREGLAMVVAAEDWNNAAAGAGNLSGYFLMLGDVTDALASAERAVLYADRGGDGFQRMVARTPLADAQHHAGRRDDATAEFQRAEAMQAERNPSYPLLYSLRGYRYCELLLAAPECEAWRRVMGIAPNVDSATVAAYREVDERAQQTLRWVEHIGSLLDIALDHLSLGRAAVYRAALDNSAPNLTSARAHLDAAVDGLRRSGRLGLLPCGLLSRALLRTLDGHLTGPDSAQEDLDEAWDIAEPGPMRLHMADVHLHRARLFASATPYPWDSPAADLQAARALIEQCGYNRRLEELADAESHLLRRP